MVRHILEGPWDLVSLGILVDLVLLGVREILFHLSAASRARGQVFHQDPPSFQVTLVVQDFQ